MDVDNIVQTCAASDIGLKRKENEDTYLIVADSTNKFDVQYHGRMYAIADGMGGHAGGKIASEMACKGLIDYYKVNKFADEKTKGFYKVRLFQLETTLHRIHDSIRRYGKENNTYAGLGTTLSVLVLIGNRTLIAHVGDSRIYRLRRDSLEQMTEDHTMAQVLIGLKYLSPQATRTHPSQHILTQAVGHDMEHIDSRVEDIKKGDIFLLCSDGLYDMVSDKEIKDILLNNSVRNEKCRQLVKRALENGGKDNITLILAQIQPHEFPGTGSL